MFAKLAIAIPVSALVTLALLLGMHSLIAMESVDVVDTTRTPQLDFVRAIPVEELIREEFEKPDLPDRIDPPPLPENSDPVDGFPVIPVAKNPPIPTGPRSGEGVSFMHDGPLITIVRGRPTYPGPAARQGLEGFVIVQFDVLPDGSVANVTVIESSSSIFERSAIQAATRFRYKARVVDGEALMTTGVKYRFKFEMNT